MNTILDYVRQDDWPHDAASVAYSALFAIAKGLHYTGHGDLIPLDWQYSPSPFVRVDPDEYLPDEYGTLGEDVNALIAAGDLD